MSIIQNIPQCENGKWYVYVILCNDGSMYKGFTDNIERRYHQHLTGTGATHTKRHKPIGLVYFEEYANQKDAVSREKYLKSGSGREWLNKRLEGDSE